MINNIIQNCSGDAINKAFNRVVAKNFTRNLWIGPKNFIKVGTREKMNNLTSATLSARKRIQIEEYIASSTIVHSSDGWNYLARSVESLINGDIASSIHFAYYAELRAGMSILASEGVGVFDKKHIWFNNLGTPTLVGGFSTHSLTDIALKRWSEQSTKKDILFSLVKVNQRSLGDWITATGSSTSSAYANSIIQSWLKKWSIDLHLKEDQEIRNVMSYRPHFKNTAVNVNTVLSKLSEIWKLLEPMASNGFPILDQHLLRIALESLFKSTTGKNPDHPDFKIYITKAFGNLGFSTAGGLFEFLLRQRSPSDPTIFEEAKKDVRNSAVNYDDPLPIISRALLLLRLSTGCSQKLVQSSVATIDSVRFWWEKISLDQGYSHNPAAIQPADLFIDIQETLDIISQNPPVTFTSVNQAFATVPQELFYIKQMQRAAIWGIFQ